MGVSGEREEAGEGEEPRAPGGAGEGLQSPHSWGVGGKRWTLGQKYKVLWVVYRDTAPSGGHTAAVPRSLFFCSHLFKPFISRKQGAGDVKGLDNAALSAMCSFENPKCPLCNGGLEPRAPLGQWQHGGRW